MNKEVFFFNSVVIKEDFPGRPISHTTPQLSQDPRIFNFSLSIHHLIHLYFSVGVCPPPCHKLTGSRLLCSSLRVSSVSEQCLAWSCSQKKCINMWLYIHIWMTLYSYDAHQVLSLHGVHSFSPALWLKQCHYHPYSMNSITYTSLWHCKSGDTCVQCPFPLVPCSALSFSYPSTWHPFKVLEWPRAISHLPEPQVQAGATPLYFAFFRHNLPVHFLRVMTTVIGNSVFPTLKSSHNLIPMTTLQSSILASPPIISKEITSPSNVDDLQRQYNFWRPRFKPRYRWPKTPCPFHHPHRQLSKTN